MALKYKLQIPVERENEAKNRDLLCQTMDIDMFVNIVVCY